ncbi:apolipoprotein A-I [Candoia aspera]|uniref:apolipoprotein A-I n=1 Tax=Candoia aspera TaxID=51853 RepID=UPI002FD7E65F
MLTLKVILALLLLTGAQARYFWQHDDPQQTRLERLQDLGQVYLESAKTAVKQAAAQFDSSTVGQELNMNLREKLETALIVTQEIKGQITPEWQEIKTDLETAWQNLKEEMTKDVDSVKAQIQPLLRRLRENMQQEIVKCLREVKSVSQELHQIAQEKLTPVAAGFRDKVRTHVDDFRKDAAPYAKQLEQLFHQKLEWLQQRGLSELTQLQTDLQQQVSDVREKYGPVWQKAREELSSWVEATKSNWASLFVVVKAPEQEAEQQSS